MASPLTHRCIQASLDILEHSISFPQGKAMEVVIFESSKDVRYEIGSPHGGAVAQRLRGLCKRLAPPLGKATDVLLGLRSNRYRYRQWHPWYKDRSRGDLRGLGPGRPRKGVAPGTDVTSKGSLGAEHSGAFGLGCRT